MKLDPHSERLLREVGVLIIDGKRVTAPEAKPARAVDKAAPAAKKATAMAKETGEAQ